MINNSTLTLQNVKDHFIRTREDENISDSDVIDAVNDFYTIVHRYERKVDPNKFRAISAATSVPSSGYDITGLTNIADRNIKAYKGSLDSGNLILRKHPGCKTEGYYFVGDTFKLTPEGASDDIVFVYDTTGSRVALTTALTEHTLQINQDLEKALREYVRASFYDGEYQFDLKQQAEVVAFAEIEEAMSHSNSVVAI